ETCWSARSSVLEMMDHGQDIYPFPMMIFRAPPEHTQLRKLVSRAFSPRRIAALENQIRQLTTGYLDQFVGAGGFDYVADFGAKLPMMVIGAMLGVPAEDRDAIRVWTDDSLRREPGETYVSERMQAVHRNLWGYFTRYIAERRTTPRDDMMTDLLEAELPREDGTTRRLDDGEVLAFIGLLSGAGNETVARLLGWTAATLARFPDERRKLTRNPGLIPNGVEELLRYE